MNKQSPVIKPDSKAFDFKSHSAYSEVRIAKAASQTLGVKSPFFRKADAVTSTKLKIEGKWVSNFASYDYLSLNLSEPIQQAVDEAVGQWGVSSTASRLVGGERELHARLEARIAEFVGTESALVMVSGHATNMALVRTLAGQGDLILVDALAHNSIYEGIRASGAQHATFPHNDFGWIDRHLSGCRRDYKNVLIIVEGLYSMDGDAPDLASFLDVKQRNDAWLMVDEAHSMGVLGKTGRGICEEQNVQVTDVEIIMGTLSKSFCSCGGFIAGSDSLIDLMRYKAQGFVYSVGLSAPNTAAALAAIDIIDEHPEYVTALTKVGEHFKATAQRLGLDTGESQGHAICPIIIGDSLKAVWIANRLLEDGFNVLPIIAPAVPDKSARLRFFLNRDHDEACVEKVLRKTASLHKQSLNMAVTDLASG
ncbi:MAG: aminotransferase class I/II-fold pyridoxal phosphate-dependent enzyme [Pseudomonadota bacterium]